MKIVIQKVMRRYTNFLLLLMIGILAGCTGRDDHGSGESQVKGPDNLKTVHPVLKEAGITVTANGFITYDQAGIVSISSRYEGRIERSFVKYTYQQVSAGQKLFEVYSPEILTAENELVFLLRSDASNDEGIRVIRERLKLLGLSDKQIDGAALTGKPDPAVSVLSPVSGVVIPDRESIPSISVSGMNSREGDMFRDVPESETGRSVLKEGSYVSRGEVLFRVARNNKVWAILQFSGEEGDLLVKGNIARITTRSNKVFQGKIDFIEPVFKNNSKTISVRIILDNGKGDLHIGDLVNGSIEVNGIRGFWIPGTALLDLGGRKVVYRKTQVGFVAHSVGVTIVKGNEVLVSSGLTGNDEILENARYLNDSDAFIKDSLVWKN
jgi:membrane fusion protein, copper/silver efflux system